MAKGAKPETSAGLRGLATEYLHPPNADAIRALATEIDQLRAHPPVTLEGKVAAVQLVNALLDRFSLRIEVDGVQAKLIVKASSDGGTIQFIPAHGGSFGGFTMESRGPGAGRRPRPKQISLVPLKPE